MDAATWPVPRSGLVSAGHLKRAWGSDDSHTWQAGSFLEYTGQSSTQLIGLHGKYRVDSILCALEWAIQAKREKKRGKLSLEEAIVLSIMALDREVNNGGFDQFFLNSCRKYVPVIVRNLETIGAGKTARLAARAIASRNDQEALDELDQEYDKGHSILLETKLWTFVERNQAAINVPPMKPPQAAPSPTPEAVPVLKPTVAEDLKQQCRQVVALLWDAKPDEALTLARKLVRSHPQASNCWKELAFVLAKRGEGRQALAASAKAIACNPTDVYLYSPACQIAAGMDSWAVCLDYAERGRRLEIDRRIRMMMTDQFSLWGARALHALGRHQEALEWLAPVPQVDFDAGSKVGPLLDPRRLAKACRAALRESK
ncbi:MAG: DUF4375 domain-containing protein [Bryobacterales bacterium]|nr:DUF4375 domain-containing protein [Bryobacterales bacterium]